MGRRGGVGMILGDVLVSERQLQVHKLTEAASLYLQVPFMIYLATRKELPAWARLTSALLAIAVVVVDGGLLATWKAKATGGVGPFANP